MASSIQNNSPIINKLNALTRCEAPELEKKIQKFINKNTETIQSSLNPAIQEGLKSLNAKLEVESEFKVKLTALEENVSANIQKAEDSIQHVKTILLEPIMDAVGKGMRALIEAHSRVNGSKDNPQLEAGVNGAVGKLKTFLVGMLEDPNVIIKETLSYCGNGGGKRNTDVTYRRWVTAFNSGDQQLEERMRQDHIACCKGNDFTDIKEIFESNCSDKEIMQRLPSLLLKHFSLTDEVLYGKAKEILEKNFSAVEEKPEALEDLAQLRKKASNLSTLLKKLDPELSRLKKQISSPKVDKLLADLREKASVGMQQFIAEVQDFVTTNVFAQAKVGQAQLKAWHLSLSAHMLTEQTVFTQLICVFLATIASHSEIIGPMLNKEMPNEAFFSLLDNIFLTSESSDCIKQESDHSDLIRLQCSINKNKSPEATVALIKIPIDNPTVSYVELGQQFPIVQYGLKRDWGQKKLEAINSQEDVLALGKELGCRVIAIPCKFLDHPVQKIREEEQKWLGGWFGGAKQWAFGGAAKFAPIRNFLLNLAKPGLHKVLPKMDAQLLGVFDEVVTELADLMTAPILDGAILDKPFRAEFKEVMSTEGVQFATLLKDVINEETISFEAIRDAMVGALTGMQEAFDECAKK